MSLGECRILSLEQRLDSLETTDENQPHHADESSNPTDIDDDHGGITNVSVGSDLEQDQSSNPSIHQINNSNTERVLDTFADIDRRIYNRLYTQLVHHLGDCLPGLEEICILREHPNMCRGTRIKGSHELDVRCETSELESIRFPTGVSHPFLLTPSRVTTKYVGMAAKEGGG